MSDTTEPVVPPEEANNPQGTEPPPETIKEVSDEQALADVAEATEEKVTD